MSLHDRVLSEAGVQIDTAWISTTRNAALSEAKAQWGKGWLHLTEEMQDAFVAHNVLSTIAGQAKTIWKDNETAATLVHLAKAGLGKRVGKH